MLETASSLNMLLPALWASFVAYATWYFTLAKRNAPLTSIEAKALWKIHKLNAKCKANRWRKITRKNRIIGFECGCGYRHAQKRPVV